MFLRFSEEPGDASRFVHIYALGGGGLGQAGHGHYIARQGHDEARACGDLEPAHRQREALGRALDGVAVVINPENTVTDLTTEQVRDIYLGNITDWSELG